MVSKIMLGHRVKGLGFTSLDGKIIKGSGVTVVGNEDFPDDALAAVRGDVAGQRFSGRCGVRAGVGGRGHRNLRTDVSRERGVMRGSKTAGGHRAGRGGRCTTCARAAALHMVADGSAVSKDCSGTQRRGRWRRGGEGGRAAERKVSQDAEETGVV